MNPSYQTISQGDLRNLWHYHFVRHWGKKVLFRVCQYSFLEGQSRQIREILEAYGISFGRRGIFTDQEITNLSVKPLEQLDITVINKVCVSLWSKGVNVPGPRLQTLVKKIKDERNNVSHEEDDVSKESFENKVNEFQSLLEETLEEVKSLFGSHATEIDDLKTEIQDAAPKLLDMDRKPFDSSNLRNEKKKFRDEVHKHTQDELKSLYLSLYKVLPYDWLAQYGVTDPSDLIANLKMDIDQKFERGVRGSECIPVTRDEILEIKDTGGEDPKAIVISGDAGSGKTTILSFILENLHKDPRNMTNLSSFEVVFYMQFRDHSQDNFDDYLQSLLPQTVSVFDLKHVKSCIMSSKCLFLCDGYDEANKKSQKLFKEILAFKCKQMKIIVTTRPGNTERLTYLVNDEKLSRVNLRVLGLSGQDMEDLIDKITGLLLKDNVSRKEEMKKELFQAIRGMDERMIAILRTPLYLNLFILLYIECPDVRKEITSITTLYIQLKKHTMKRIMKKTGIYRELLEDFDDLYNKRSLKNYIKRKYEWSEMDGKDFKSEIRSQEVLENFDTIMSSYFNIKHKIQLLEMENVFCYRHKSEQEFAVAQIICKEIEVIAKSDRNQEGNIVEIALLSKGIQNSQTATLDRDQVDGLPKFEKSGALSRQKLNKNPGAHYMGRREKVRGLLQFITGILYNSNKDMLYRAINNIHELILKDDGRTIHFDPMLVPWKETRFDQKVFESLIEVLGRISGKRTLSITKTESLFALPSLLPKLKPKDISVSISGRLRRNLPALKAALNAASAHSIPAHLELYMYLKDLAAPSGSALCTVDSLELRILDDELDDLSKLHAFPLISKKFEVHFLTENRNVKETSQILNTVWPRKLKGKIVRTLSNGEFSASPTDKKLFTFSEIRGRSKFTEYRHREAVFLGKLKKFFSEKHGHLERKNSSSSLPTPKLKRKKQRPNLILHMTNSCHAYTDDDIRTLLESLTIKPLSSITIWQRRDIKNKEDLKAFCAQKDLGKLILPRT